MTAPTLRVLTANLLYDRADAAAFGDLLQRMAPDVVAVQELGRACAGEIAGRYPYGELHPADHPRGMGLAAACEVSSTRLPMGRIDGLVARLEPRAWPMLRQPVHIVTVHFANPVAWPPWRMVALRRSQVAALRRFAGGADRLAVVGDCNATPVWPAYRRLREFLDDGVRVWARSAGVRPPRTWGPMPGGPKLLRIDHVLVRGVQVTAVQRLEIPGSDHAALVADITV